jgi:hypothetical protein
LRSGISDKYVVLRFGQSYGIYLINNGTPALAYYEMKEVENLESVHEILHGFQ